MYSMPPTSIPPKATIFSTARITLCEGVDRIKKIAAECFDATNVFIARQDQFLDKRRPIDSQIQRSFINGRAKVLDRIKTHDPGAPSPDIWLHQQWESDVRCRRE